MGEKIWEFSKEKVNYRLAPKPAVRCDACKFMFPRTAVGSCKIVRGTIKGSHTCDEFMPVPK